MATKVNHIHIENAALDTSETMGVLRGVISTDTLQFLQIDDYQREELPPGARSSILKALRTGQPLLDLILGMRGDNYAEEFPGKVTLKGPVYIIDGYQRMLTAFDYMKEKPEARVRLGAKIYLDTNYAWERDQFDILNSKRIKVAPSVLLRNRRDESAAVKLLWQLTTTQEHKPFVMHGRVSWGQNLTGGHLLPASMFARFVSTLHAHKSITGANDASEGLTTALDRMVLVVGEENLRSNIYAFWNLIDTCWGIRKISYRHEAVYIKGSFVHSLAKLLSDHHDFWEKDPEEKKLFIPRELVNKLKLFGVNDPSVERLAGSGGKARNHLYLLMLEHVNSGKRTKRLRSRFAGAVQPVETDETTTDEAEAA